MLQNVFIKFLDQENIGIDTKIMTLHPLVFKLLPKQDFEGGHLGKWPKGAFSPSFFSGNIANIIPGRPLNKMIPLMEDHGGGCTGSYPGPWTTES